MPLRPVFVLCLAEALSMAGFSTYPALLPLLRGEWQMNNTEAGLVGGAFFGGYMVAVPVLVGMTDRVAARRIYVVGCALLALGALGFALLAGGVWTAAAMQVVCGAGLAGTYMPGLKDLSDRVTGPRQGRAIAFYTSTFGIGTSLSLLLAGSASAAWGWRATFAVAAAGPVVAALLVTLLLAPLPQGAAGERRRLFDFRPVVRNRAAVGIIAGYSAHCWELFALRSWMVAFFAFSAATYGWPIPVGGAAIAAAINLLGPPASILGNEIAAGRRRRIIVLFMCVSAVLALTAAASAWLPTHVTMVLVAAYFVAIMSDSAALTAGLVESVPRGARGGAMALHSFGGFAAGLAAPLVFGALLDLGGGDAQPQAWSLAFGSLTVIALAGAFAVGRSRPSDRFRAG